MKKQTIIVLIIVIVLSASVSLGYFFKTSQRQERKVSLVLFKDINIDDIKTVTVNGETVERDNDKNWIYRDTEQNIIVPVVAERVEEFLNTIKQQQRGRLVESDAQDLTKYNLTGNTETDAPYSVSAKDKDGQELISFKMSQSNPSFAQFNQETAVYKVDNSSLAFS